jgi:hypothetical protein
VGAAIASREWGAFIRKRMPATGSAITICHYYKLPHDYARSMANSSGRSMLFSSGDSSRTLASILSGEGFDAGNREESPFYILAAIPNSLLRIPIAACCQ